MVKVASERDAEGVARVLERAEWRERKKERKKEKIERIKKYIVT
jgi:hypothetical protein